MRASKRNNTWKEGKMRGRKKGRGERKLLPAGGERRLEKEKKKGGKALDCATLPPDGAMSARLPQTPPPPDVYHLSPSTLSSQWMGGLKEKRKSHYLRFTVGKQLNAPAPSPDSLAIDGAYLAEAIDWDAPHRT